jgi:protein-disulfide isomerase
MGRTAPRLGAEGPCPGRPAVREAWVADLCDDGARPDPSPTEAPLSGSNRLGTSTRRDRRAAQRNARTGSGRATRGTRQGSGGRHLGTGTIMVAAALAGVLIVVFVAMQQLGGRASGGNDLRDPGLAFPTELADGASIGRADAPVTLEVWEDFQCPVCARHSLEIEPVLVGTYVRDGVLRIVHHDLAFLGRGGADDESVLAASGAVCADRQDAYWDYAHWVYANQDGENAGGFRPERLRSIAEAAGVDVTDWDACVSDAAVRQQVADSTAEGIGQGVNSTPTMYLNGTRLDPPGLRSAQELGQLIEAAAAAAGSSASPSASPSAAP